MNKKLLSVLIPCRNEEKYIVKSMDSVFNQDYPNEFIEVFVIDGMSSDNTREIIKEYQKTHSNLFLLDNPEGFVPYALNYGIDKAKGDYIIRLDAHSEYPSNYFSKLIKNITQLDAKNVGGVWNTLPGNDSNLAMAIAIASSHPHGIGNPAYKIGANTVKRVGTVPYGCYPREVFEEIGKFDTDLIRNQDDEFNARLTQNGGKIYLIPDLVINYYAREKVSKMSKMFYQYGVFKPLVNSKLKKPATIRQFAPPLLVIFLLFGWIPGFINKLFYMLYTGGVLFYLFILISVSFTISIKRKKLLLSVYLPYLFLIIHFSYGVGYLIGVINLMSKNKFESLNLIKSNQKIN